MSCSYARADSGIAMMSPDRTAGGDADMMDVGEAYNIMVGQNTAVSNMYVSNVAHIVHNHHRYNHGLHRCVPWANDYY